MNKYRRYLLLPITVAILATASLYYILSAADQPIHNATLINRCPRIRPDYNNTVIPPNIAPLNFLVNEPGRRYYVRIYSDQGKDINVHSKKASIVIPIKPWKELLQDN